MCACVRVCVVGLRLGARPGAINVCGSNKRLFIIECSPCFPTLFFFVCAGACTVFLKAHTHAHSHTGFSK